MDKSKRLQELEQQASGMEQVPFGLQLQITRLQTELGIIECNDDDGCLTCGS